MTAAQRHLLRKAQDSVRGAKLLAANSLWDIAISRAYYAMFYVAQALLLGKGLAFSKHHAVIAAFGKHFARTAEVPSEFHRLLIDAEDRRIVADYRGPNSLTESDAVKEIAHAERFLALGEQLLGPLPASPEQSV